MIEFAIAIPILILFLMILFECGRLYSVYMRFTDAAWQGARFFSSLKNPSASCIGDETTNLAYVTNEDAKQFSSSLIFQSHKIVHERVTSLFLYRPDSWPIKGTGTIPCTNPPCPELATSEFFSNMPEISTQYIRTNAASNCPTLYSNRLSQLSDYDNTVTVCLEATYTGLFFNIPLHVCSTSHLLENSENLIVPYAYYDDF